MVAKAQQRQAGLVALFGPKLVAALGGVADANALVKAYQASNSGQDAYGWLQQQGFRGKIVQALTPVLTQLWANAWELGVQKARQKAHFQGQPNQQAFQQMLNRNASQWLNQITTTILKGLAAILAAGGAGMAAAITALLASAYSAQLVARTEVTRGVAAGEAATYRLAGIQQVEWVTTSGNPCPLCLANEASGPHFLGQPFPSGATEPPQHPNCGCELVPV